MFLLALVFGAALINQGATQTFSQIDPLSIGYDITRCGPLDIALIIDASGSIGPRRFSKMLSFVADSLKAGDFQSNLRVAALTFSKRSVVEFLLNTHVSKPDPKQEVLNNIAELVYTKGVTNTSGALRVASETLFQERNGDRDAVQNLAVIITDGNSNVDRDPIQDANKLKADGVYIVGILIGTDKSINQEEMEAIVSNKDELIRLKKYEDLIPFRETIVRRMCTPFFSPPNCQEGKIEKKDCRKMQCINGEWKNVGFYGCCFKGRFLSWNQDYQFECDTYRCFQKGACQDDACENFNVNKVKDGCMVGDKCIDDGASVVEENVCETFKCEAGEYKMIQKDCLAQNGQCMKVGAGYTEHCVVYQCQNIDGMVEFRPVQTGCSYKGTCYDLGARVMEDCNTLVCSYDDVSLGYDLILQQQGCNDNGRCRNEGDMWVNTDLCIRYSCVYNKRKDRVVIRERTMGCQADNGCIQKGSEVSAQGCIRYICNKKGDLEILSVGCEFNGACKAVNETWQSPTDKCTNYVCLTDIADDGTPTAYVQKDQDCHDFNGNCIKVGRTVQENCNTYTCDANGHLEPTTVKCSYKGSCYDIGAKWIDDVACKKLSCRMRSIDVYPRIIKNNIGCIDESGRCYLENATKQIENSCLEYKCYEDRLMRLEVCEYKHACYDIGSSWVDKDDCVTVRCLRDPGTGNAIVDTYPYGCFMDNVCHDPGYKFTKDCQEIQCRGGMMGFQVVKEACTWKGGCKEKDQTWFDPQTCTKYGCYEDEDGLDVNEITYGCTSDSNQCIKGGAEHNEGCNKYECNNGKLKVISMGCEFNDGCLAAGKKYFDKENCVHYSCIAKNTTDGSITTQLKERWGCFDYDRCYLPTWKKTEDCTTYRCRGKTRSFSIVNTECEWMGKCISVNTTWDHPTQCLTYKCVLGESTGIARVSSDLWGCKDEFGNCHPFGKQRQSDRCVTTECQMRPEGPVFYPVEIGCKFRKRCKKVDSSWINRRKCVQQTCQYAPGATAPNVVNSPYGCRDMKNRCRPFGYVARDPENVCVSYKCTAFEIFSTIQTGCPWQGKCMQENDVWYDEEGTCTLYKCIRENVGPSNVQMHTLSYPGCRGFDGECLKEGQIVTKGCTKYQCIPNSGGLVIVQEGCSYGGECKVLNSTWFDSETCTDYSCVYDSEANDISIVEKTGCKDDDGKCFTKGERKKEGCNKFLCNAASNFRPIRMRCEFRGECKDIDTTWKEGCITYTCKLVAKGPNFVQTNIEEIHGCIGDDGKCYDIGDELIEDCSKFTCTAGGVMQESDFGCKGFNGQCMKPGDKLEVDCVNYVCDGQAKSMVPVEKECVWKNGCKPVGSKWFDKESCRGYSCVLDITDNDVKITERTVGCSVSGECKRSRTYQMKDCVQYKCTTNGQLIPKKIGCEWDGECADLGMSWTRNCTHYKCVITQEGPDYIQTEVKQQRGCFDSHGKCYDVMDEVSFGCNKYRCSMGGNLDLIDSGCMDRYGRCMKPGEIVEEADGSEHKCVCDGSSCLVVVEVKGCRMNSTLYPFGARLRDGCTVYECQNRDNCGKFVPVEWGCYWVDRCYGPGDKWKSDRGCSIFTCTMYQKSNGDVDMVVARDIGCPFEDECKQNNEQWRDGCFEKKCRVRTTKDNSKESSIKIVSGGCQEGVGDGMICHAVGSIWEEHHYDGCFKKQCYVDQTTGKYTTTIVGAACRDAYGSCRPIGSSGFDAYVSGQLRQDCKCLSDGVGVTGVRYTCGDMVNPFQCEGC